MLAKLENLGSFQLFFTLSCADLRWEENFAAILRDQGLNLIYSVVPDEEGHHITKIEVQFHKGGELITRSLKKYLEEEGKTSLHELIRGNVLLATRYFNDRVKKFMNIIVMGSNNPMFVKYHPEKVEFQDRGAGHIHGTLWLRLNMIERLIKLENGELALGRKQGSDTPESHNGTRLFQGISLAFKKLKNNKELEGEEMDALANFIDEYTSVSTNENEVGKDISRMVVNVNKYCHTKTCRKYDTTCRFGYPRYPFNRTLIAEPVKGENEREKNEKLKRYEETLKKVGDVLNDNDVVNGIIALIGTSEQESLSEYEENEKTDY